MRTKTPLVWIILFELIAVTAAAQSPTSPPVTRTDNVTEELHGVKIADPYRWLEDQNSSETRGWIEAQNKYTQSVLSTLSGRDRIRAQVEQVLKVDTISAPTERGGRYFFTARRGDQAQAVVYVRLGVNAPDKVLLDPNTMSTDQTVSVAPLGISRDGRMMAYGVRQGGEDEVTVHFLNIDSGKDLPDQMPRARYSGMAIKPDRSGLYYSKFTAGLPGLYYHALGTDPASDQKLLGDGLAPADFIGPNVSRDGHYLTITISHGSSGDNVKVYIKDLRRDGPIVPIVDEVPARFQATVEGDH
ncbi:MAG TPA: S9 family peptidase, partial [Blastocatellia bacterium]